MKCNYLNAKLTHVFVHVESFNIFEANSALSMIFNQVFIHSEWSASNEKQKYAPKLFLSN